MPFRFTRIPSAFALLLTCVLLASAARAQEAGSDDDGLRVIPKIEIPMRDGTILRGVLQQPREGGPFPVLLFRTPYGAAPRYKQLAKRAYIVVAVDMRGRYSSDGQYESYYRHQTRDASDGYDTVQWCAKLPNSTGEVGTFGYSYNALLQWRAAATQPPALRAMAAFSIPPRHTDLEGPGSIRPARRLQWWYATIGNDLRTRSGRTAPPYKEVHEKLISTLPWSALPDEVFETEKEPILAYFRNPQLDMWKLDEAAAKTIAPNLNLCGWYDHCNSIALHQAITQRGASETARRDSRLIVGPWAHHTLGARKTGDFDFGPDADVDLDRLQADWFDQFLKQKQTGVVSAGAPVRIFVMGRNQWRDEQTWPPMRAKQTRLYLTSNGRANTPAGDGKLLEAAASQASQDRYTYDPNDPVPSIIDANGFPRCGDQNISKDRRDILVYQSEPLTKAVEVTGDPVMELYAASSAPDTDWIVRLVDVSPDGVARDVSSGIVRARYRDGFDKEHFLTPGETVKYAIRMGPTSNEFQAGHRIRVDITSSDFPSYDRNHNTAVNQFFDAELRTAEQTIHHGGQTPSAIVLPVIPE